MPSSRSEQRWNEQVDKTAEAGSERLLAALYLQGERIRTSLMSLVIAAVILTVAVLAILILLVAGFEIHFTTE